MRSTASNAFLSLLAAAAAQQEQQPFSDVTTGTAQDRNTRRMQESNNIFLQQHEVRPGEMVETNANSDDAGRIIGFSVLIAIVALGTTVGIFVLLADCKTRQSERRQRSSEKSVCTLDASSVTASEEYDDTTADLEEGVHTKNKKKRDSCKHQSTKNAMTKSFVSTSSSDSHNTRKFSVSSIIEDSKPTVTVHKNIFTTLVKAFRSALTHHKEDVDYDSDDDAGSALSIYDDRSCNSEAQLLGTALSSVLRVPTTNAYRAVEARVLNSSAYNELAWDEFQAASDDEQQIAHRPSHLRTSALSTSKNLRPIVRFQCV
jgi:hypothetical protein